MFAEPEPTPEWLAEHCPFPDDEELMVALAQQPNALERVLEVATITASFAAEQYRRIDTMRSEALAEAAQYGQKIAEVAERSLRLELASALRITENAADRLIVTAEALVHRYSAVLDALARADVTERHAQILVDELDALDPAVRGDLLLRALALAVKHPVGTFRRLLRKLIDTARFDTLAERQEQALGTRRTAVTPCEDGMAWFGIYTAAVEAQAMDNRATQIAKLLATNPDETRSLDQLRADVAADLLLEGGASVHPPEARGIRATVTVTVPALSLLSDDGAGPAGPAVVEGVGPIPTGRARELCGGADGWMRILTHPETGTVVSVGRDQYRPPAALRRLVRWRADRCMAPGCGMPASRCEIDHTVAWDHGGTTSLSNLNPLCKGHHTVKHHSRWQVTQLPDSGGAMEWISPAGRRYVVEPERRIPTFTPEPDPVPAEPPPF